MSVPFGIAMPTHHFEEAKNLDNEIDEFDPGYLLIGKAL